MFSERKPGGNLTQDGISTECFPVLGPGAPIVKGGTVAQHPDVCAQSLHHVRFYDPMDCSLPGSGVRGISQARILKWIAFPTPRNLPDPGIKPTSCVSCIGRQVLYHYCHLGSPKHPGVFSQTSKTEFLSPY